MNRSLNELDKLTREQQQLRDETFRDRQRQSRRDPATPARPAQAPASRDKQGQQGQEGTMRTAISRPGQASAKQNLKQRQEALRDRLEQLQKRMKQFGMKGEQGFDDAEEAMQEAEEGLGEGGQRGQDKAVDAQGRALEGLRKGAQSMAQQMQQGEPGEGQAVPGPGDPNGPMREGRNQPNPDPLGRESRDRTYNPQSRYDPLGAPRPSAPSACSRNCAAASPIRSRPREELDYLERLLRRY